MVWIFYRRFSSRGEKLRFNATGGRKGVICQWWSAAYTWSRSRTDTLHPVIRFSSQPNQAWDFRTISWRRHTKSDSPCPTRPYSLRLHLAGQRHVYLEMEQTSVRTSWKLRAMHGDSLFSFGSSYIPQWGAADAEIKVPSGENTGFKRSPFKARCRLGYSHTCYIYCQGFLPCLFLPFRSIHLHFPKTSPNFSCVGCG